MGIPRFSNQSSNKKKGYTLIEILVSLTIIGAIFGFGYASFRDFSRRQAVADAAKLIQGDLRFAQENAMAGQKPAGCNTTLDSYSFNRLSSTRYTIDANCGAATVTVKDVNVSFGITLSTPSPNPIKFNVLGRGTNVDGSGGSENWELILTQEVTTNSVTVIVTPGGEIK